MSRNDCVAVVTGGMTGIGLATVQTLSRQGVRVAVGARRAGDPATIEAFRSAAGDAPLLHILDVQSVASIDAFMSATVSALGPVDILVNSAGISTYQLVDGHDEDAWTRVLDINLNGPFRMIRACLPHMKAQEWGRIVNVASTAARTAVADAAAYCASKAGLLGLSRAVALEGAPHGITCVTVSPTWVETEMLQKSAVEAARKNGVSVEDQLRTIAAANPQERLVQPSEVAEVIALACSDAAPGLTMEDIQLNAGAHW